MRCGSRISQLTFPRRSTPSTTAKAASAAVACFRIPRSGTGCRGCGFSDMPPSCAASTPAAWMSASVTRLSGVKFETS